MLINRSIFLTIAYHFLSTTAKIYDRCEFARELKLTIRLSYPEIETWTCIAKYQSNFDTATESRSPDGITYHGLYQVSDRYWCARYPFLKRGCDIDCSRLRDGSLIDDFECLKIIYDEHERLSGNGYTAWTAWNNYCSNPVTRSEVVNGCFNEPTNQRIDNERSLSIRTSEKIYERCELARELKTRHQIDDEQLATWLCIVKHESNYNTSAVGRLNADGSTDHGLFQISDRFWCSPYEKGGACSIQCSDFRDSDIADDIRCVRQIFDEHRRLSGNGFLAWTVYPLFCQENVDRFIDQCFPDPDPIDDNSIEIIDYLTHRPAITAPAYPNYIRTIGLDDRKEIDRGRIYDRCELATEFRDKHKIPMKQIPIWLCIARHASNYNTSAIGTLPGQASHDHGLFQISDIYWCSPPGTGWLCDVTCDKLRDSDLTDDIRCARRIFNEHERFSGNGFKAWSIYRKFCTGDVDKFTEGCFPSDRHDALMVARGKIYEKCELAKELRDRHQLPRDQLGTWVCIAYYESKYNTSALGYGDHGLFQISDLFWCSKYPDISRACGLSCDRLRDSDITDDVACVKQIFDEHQRLSGNGFTAWTVYEPYCQKADSFVDNCFDEDNEIIPTEKPIGKVYDRCELARELQKKHSIPDRDIPTWVCIAQHESGFNTSAIGRLNGDSSADHGIFQINDRYWCTPSSGDSFACNVPCSALRDDDLTDDVRCVRKIYNEHQTISGDGFNAWTAYQEYCQGSVDRYVNGCFEDVTKGAETTTPTTIATRSISKLLRFDDLFKIDKSTKKSFSLFADQSIETTTLRSTIAPFVGFTTKSNRMFNEFLTTTDKSTTTIEDRRELKTTDRVYDNRFSSDFIAFASKKNTILPIVFETTSRKNVFFSTTRRKFFNNFPAFPTVRTTTSTITNPTETTVSRSVPSTSELTELFGETTSTTSSSVTRSVESVINEESTESVFDIYFNGFQTRKPTTYKPIITNRSTIDPFYATRSSFAFGTLISKNVFRKPFTNERSTTKPFDFSILSRITTRKSYRRNATDLMEPVVAAPTRYDVTERSTVPEKNDNKSKSPFDRLFDLFRHR